ncbi:MAG: hypothetical protein WAS05_02480 [Candidatus Nanopelagicales bacterium]
MSNPKNVTFEPKLVAQCVGFMIGSLFFTLGATPGLSEIMGPTTCNWLFFIGSWFFTAAGFIQLLLSGNMRNTRGKLRAMWLAAATQFAGTILFNISTGAAIDAQTTQQEMQLVWNPNAAGSALFLISGAFTLLVLVRSGTIWGPVSKDWSSSWVNMLGCIAFGVSAFGSLVLPDGAIKDAFLANSGTFIGAICFFLASAVILPEAIRTRNDKRQREPAHLAQDIIDYPKRVVKKGEEYPKKVVEKGEELRLEHQAKKLEQEMHELEVKDETLQRDEPKTTPTKPTKKPTKKAAKKPPK